MARSLSASDGDVSILVMAACHQFCESVEMDPTKVEERLADLVQALAAVQKQLKDAGNAGASAGAGASSSQAMSPSEWLSVPGVEEDVVSDDCSDAIDRISDIMEPHLEPLEYLEWPEVTHISPAKLGYFVPQVLSMTQCNPGASGPMVGHVENHDLDELETETELFWLHSIRDHSALKIKLHICKSDQEIKYLMIQLFTYDVVDICRHPYFVV